MAEQTIFILNFQNEIGHIVLAIGTMCGGSLPRVKGWLKGTSSRKLQKGNNVANDGNYEMGASKKYVVPKIGILIFSYLLHINVTIYDAASVCT